MKVRTQLSCIDYFSQLTTNWGQIMAYAWLIIIPVLELFIAFQRSFITRSPPPV